LDSRGRKVNFIPDDCVGSEKHFSDVAVSGSGAELTVSGSFTEEGVTYPVPESVVTFEPVTESSTMRVWLVRLKETDKTGVLVDVFSAMTPRYDFSASKYDKITVLFHCNVRPSDVSFDTLEVRVPTLHKNAKQCAQAKGSRDGNQSAKN
jgi:hypothetical protein